MAERSPTPSALLELREERQVVREGYRFLDEKRLLLASEILEQLENYERVMDRFRQLHSEAAAALADATARHGLQGLEVYPVASMEEAEVQIQVRTFLGVRLTTSQLRALGPGAAEVRNPDPSPEAERAQELFRKLVFTEAELAGISGNLERLQEEYRRTERRVRALEDVIIPEVESELQEIQSHLEELEQEEAIRTHLDYGERR